MKIKRTARITYETTRSFSAVITQRRARLFCSACNLESEMLSINEAAGRLTTTWRKIVFLIAEDRLHFAETDNGEIYVCGRSLANWPQGDAIEQITEELEK